MGYMSIHPEVRIFYEETKLETYDNSQILILDCLQLHIVYK